MPYSDSGRFRRHRDHENVSPVGIDSVGRQGDVHAAGAAAPRQSVQGRDAAAGTGDARDDHGHGECRAQCREALSRARVLRRQKDTWMPVTSAGVTIL